MCHVGACVPHPPTKPSVRLWPSGAQGKSVDGPQQVPGCRAGHLATIQGPVTLSVQAKGML